MKPLISDVASKVVTVAAVLAGELQEHNSSEAAVKESKALADIKAAVAAQYWLDCEHDFMEQEDND